MLIEEFKVKLKEVFPEYEDYYGVISYKNAHNVVIEDKFGLHKTMAKSLYKKLKPSIKTAVNKIDYITKKLDVIGFSDLKVIDIIGRKVVVENSYGACLCTINSLLRGSYPTIQTAMNKEGYATNILKEYTNEDFIVLDVIIENSQTKAIVEYDSELYSISFQILKNYKSIFSIWTVIDKNKYIHKQLLLNNDYYLVFFKLKDDFNYTSMYEKIRIETKYGDCYSNIHTLLKGSKPTIKSAVDKTIFFKNLLKEKGSLYVEQDFKYTLQHTKIKLFCETHGFFYIAPKKILNGKKCVKCANLDTSKRLQENPLGWGYTEWEEAALRSSNFKSFSVYVIRCWNENEEFYKIGRTFLEIYKRFNKHSMPYNYEVIEQKSYNIAREACEKEIELQSINSMNKYEPKIHFSGKYECFKTVSYEL